MTDATFERLFLGGLVAFTAAIMALCVTLAYLGDGGALGGAVVCGSVTVLLAWFILPEILTLAPIEEWRPVAGFEAHYEVSRNGDIRSFSRLLPLAAMTDNLAEAVERIERYLALFANEGDLAAIDAAGGERVSFGDLRTILSSLKGDEGWQPIEQGWGGPAYEHGVTWGDAAPRDGRDVLLFVERTGEQFAGYWENGDWVYAICRKTRIVCEPTHWRPLPNPPAISVIGER